MMSTSVAPSSDRAQVLLVAAQQKLHANDMPKLLRFTAFLRLSCLTLNQPGTFADLLQQLSCYPSWWLTCEVTSAGTLKSSQAAICALLEPVNRLHQPQLPARSLPWAA